MVVLRQAFCWGLGLSLPFVVFGLVGMSVPGGRWLLTLCSILATGLGLLLPFAAFAGGSAGRQRAAQVLGPATLGPAITSGLVLGVATYVLLAFASPLLQHPLEVHAGWTTEAAAARFGPPTPSGILRNLMYVEANPPQEYTTRIELPETRYPSRLRMALHRPIAFGVLALVNVFVGWLAASATQGLAPRRGRRVRAAVGLAGSLACFAAFVVAMSPDRDWNTASGVVAAWAPLAVPVLEALTLAMVARRVGPKHRSHALRESSSLARTLQDRPAEVP